MCRKSPRRGVPTTSSFRCPVRPPAEAPACEASVTIERSTTLSSPKNFRVIGTSTDLPRMVAFSVLPPTMYARTLRGESFQFAGGFSGVVLFECFQLIGVAPRRVRGEPLRCCRCRCWKSFQSRVSWPCVLKELEGKAKSRLEQVTQDRRFIDFLLRDSQVFRPLVPNVAERFAHHQSAAVRSASGRIAADGSSSVCAGLPCASSAFFPSAGGPTIAFSVMCPAVMG